MMPLRKRDISLKIYDHHLYPMLDGWYPTLYLLISTPECYRTLWRSNLTSMLFTSHPSSSQSKPGRKKSSQMRWKASYNLMEIKHFLICICIKGFKSFMPFSSEYHCDIYCDMWAQKMFISSSQKCNLLKFVLVVNVQGISHFGKVWKVITFIIFFIDLQIVHLFVLEH